MLPDVVEYDRLESGEHRGGMYYGVWGFTFKLTSALGIALSGWVLQLAGYVPNVPQSTETLRVIRLFFGPIPLVITLVALPLLIRYPITRQIHAQMRQQLEAMASSVGNST
jgi:GPH family glycoside/pentoside/hexuronide:cation symporter